MKTYKPAGDANGVLVVIPEADATVYVEAGFTTDDALVAAALDTNPAVVSADVAAPVTAETVQPVPSGDAPADAKGGK